MPLLGFFFFLEEVMGFVNKKEKKGVTGLCFQEIGPHLEKLMGFFSET